jgi:hypothetical protein
MGRGGLKSIGVATIVVMASVSCDPTGPVSAVDLTGDWHSVPGLPVSPLDGARAYSFSFSHSDTTLTGTWTAFGDRGPVVPNMSLDGLVEGSSVGFTMTLETFNVTCFASRSDCPPQYFSFVGTIDDRNSMSGTMYPSDSARFSDSPANGAVAWAWRLHRSRQPH